jgi:nucleotide-binding universal stress UspA family protein
VVDEVNEGAPIVVGMDGSPSSEEALRWGLRQARLTGGPVDAVLAWDFPPFFGISPGSEIDFHGEAVETLDTAVRDVVGADDANRIRQVVVRGHPASVLMEAAADADLLVVGARGHGGFAGMLLGSVSQHVVAHAPCPVVVVHEHGAAPVDAGGEADRS